MLGHTYPCFQTASGFRKGSRFNITAMAPENYRKQKNPRSLCLHGFRTSGRILQASISKWPDTILRNLDLDFLDAPFPATGKSDVERFFIPPYYEWYQANKEFKEYRNFEECLAYIEDYMIKNGPFDGLLGFSQGAFLCAAIPGMQEQGTALTKVPKVKFLVIISGAKIPGLMFGEPKVAVNAFSSPVCCPSLHFIGERDFLKTEGQILLESFVKPVVIHHSGGHIIPKLDTQAEETVLSFFQRIRQMLSDESVVKEEATKLGSVIGIDLRTTYSCQVWMLERNHDRFVLVSSRHKRVPVFVMMRNYTFGNDASGCPKIKRNLRIREDTAKIPVEP